MLIISRQAGATDKLRAYKVNLDGGIVGHVYEGDELKYELSEGKHILYMVIDWASSSRIEFDHRKNNDVKFIAQSNLDQGKVFLVLFYMLFMFRKWIRLTQVTSK